MIKVMGPLELSEDCGLFIIVAIFQSPPSLISFSYIKYVVKFYAEVVLCLVDEVRCITGVPNLLELGVFLNFFFYSLIQFALRLVIHFEHHLMTEA